jgi:hypothetical protein
MIHSSTRGFFVGRLDLLHAMLIDSTELFRKGVPALRVHLALLLTGFIAAESGVVETSFTVEIMGPGMMSERDLIEFFMECNPEADEERVARLAALYMDEAAYEGVNWDIAFVQMCLETGFLRFGGLVTEDMNNFCGLGATDQQHPGHSFPDARTGIRAHIQHLKAYASTEALAGECVDPRFHYVNPRGRAPDIYGLAGSWAADPEYGNKLADLLERLYLICSFRS